MAKTMPAGNYVAVWIDENGGLRFGPGRHDSPNLCRSRSAALAQLRGESRAATYRADWVSSAKLMAEWADLEYE